jgi:DHA1 family inner membrane transport protein
LIVDRFGLLATPWIGAPVVLGGFGLTTLSGWLDRTEGAAHAAGRSSAAVAH